MAAHATDHAEILARPLVMVACEVTGTVRDMFNALGVAAISCDILPADHPLHVCGDMFECYERFKDSLVLVIAHPPCTYLSASGLHWNARPGGEDRAQKTREALDFVRRIMDLPVPMLAVENPVGCIGTEIRKADQYVQPYEFGDDASKKTGLWLRNLPLLRADPSQRVHGRWVAGKERWANQTDSGQNRLSQSSRRGHARSVTYEGIARAMAEQWGPRVREYASNPTVNMLDHTPRARAWTVDEFMFTPAPAQAGMDVSGSSSA